MYFVKGWSFYLPLTTECSRLCYSNADLKSYRFIVLSADDDKNLEAFVEKQTPLTDCVC